MSVAGNSDSTTLVTGATVAAAATADAAPDDTALSWPERVTVLFSACVALIVRR